MDEIVDTTDGPRRVRFVTPEGQREEDMAEVHLGDDPDDDSIENVKLPIRESAIALVRSEKDDSISLVPSEAGH